MSKRSRFGCQTCKIRKVKCDETLPFCKRCTETGRYCDGPSKNKSIFVPQTRYLPRQTSLKSIGSQLATPSPPTQLSPVPNLQGPDRRALSYFIERAGPALGGELDQDFWHGSVLQLCHESPMVRSAVLAVSILYEKPLSNPLSWPTCLNTNFTLPQHRQAFQWYTQSLNGMSQVLHRPSNQEQVQLALTSCILFACIEIQQLSVVNSMQLLKCGYNLLCHETALASPNHSSIIRGLLLPIFIRQTIVLLLHGHSLPDGWLPDELTALKEAPSTINSLHDARIQLFLLMFDGISLLTKAYGVFDPTKFLILTNAQKTIHERLQTWRLNFNAYVNAQCPSTLSLSQTRTVYLLQIYYLTTFIWLSACSYPSETIYDNFTSDFTTLLGHVESFLSCGGASTSEITYTFEIGIIPPLYFVGWRCRVPQIRRRALQLLEQAPAQESLFHRDVQIWTLRRIIELEEGLPPGTDIKNVQGTLPPEEARLRYVNIRWDMETTKTEQGNKDGKTTFPVLVYSQYLLEEDENGHLKGDMKVHSVSPTHP